ncbi:unnamed protein product [Dibothriocephalus latus]|uniref:Cilia- and flagella-associated protein 69 ARM repeats domain-containing protein n=1 Tax=Dibothriocephalus latus TaxID=60516 RepID=A0A3P6T5L9_DIBLA|nr:unnamed protein product [Dibothriocephalus latus]
MLDIVLFVDSLPEGVGFNDRPHGQTVERDCNPHTSKIGFTVDKFAMPMPNFPSLSSVASKYYVAKEHVSFAYLLAALARSTVTEGLCKLLKTSPPQRQKLRVLENLSLISSRLTACCARIIHSKCLSAVCVGADPTDADELLRHILDIFANILDNAVAADMSAFADQLVNMDTLGFLRGAFLHHLARTRVQKSRQLRNDILAFVVHFTCFLREEDLTDTVAQILDMLGWDFLHSLLDILVGFRSKGLTDIFHRVQLPSNEENFELAKLLFTFFTNLSDNEGIIKVG